MRTFKSSMMLPMFAIAPHSGWPMTANRKPWSHAVPPWRILLLLVVALLVLETILAWQFGSARAGDAADPMRVRPARWLTPLWFVPMALCVLAFGVVAHAAITGEFLGFLPASVRVPIERYVGVPEAAPGEGTRWRLESMAFLTGDAYSDRWLAAGLIVLGAIFVWQIYRRERPGPNAAGPLPRWRNPLARLGSLRFGLLVLAVAVLLPQVKLAFEREGWPDVVVAIDDSRSMGIVDTFRDPEVRARADELKAKWAELAAPRIRKLQARADEIRQSVASDPSSVDAARIQGRTDADRCANPGPAHAAPAQSRQGNAGVRRRRLAALASQTPADARARLSRLRSIDANGRPQRSRTVPACPR